MNDLKVAGRDVVFAQKRFFTASVLCGPERIDAGMDGSVKAGGFKRAGWNVLKFQSNDINSFRKLFNGG